MPEEKKNAMEFRKAESKDDKLIFTNLIESAFSNMADKKSRKNFTNINLNADKLWVLDINGSLIGTMTADRMKDRDDIWLISAMTVVPYWRKGGLATFMLKKALAELKAAGCKIALAFLHPELEVAEHLFLDNFHFISQNPAQKRRSPDEDEDEDAPTEERPQEAYLASLKL